jgi:hypothetical protein
LAVSHWAFKPPPETTKEANDQITVQFSVVSNIIMYWISFNSQLHWQSIISNFIHEHDWWFISFDENKIKKKLLKNISLSICFKEFWVQWRYIDGTYAMDRSLFRVVLKYFDCLIDSLIRKWLPRSLGVTSRIIWISLDSNRLIATFRNFYQFP